MTTTHRTLSQAFLVLALILFLTTFLLTRQAHPALHDLFRLLGFESLLLGVVVQQPDRTSALLAITFAVSALLSAVGSYALWSKLGALAILPGLLPVFLAATTIFLTKPVPHEPQLP